MVRVSQTPYHFELKEIQFKLIFCFISINSALICADQSVTNACSICTCRRYQTEIDCDGLKLNSVPKAIPASMESLYLFDNQITNIEKDTFKDLVNVTILYLSGNKITNIEKDAFKDLINLKSLYLDNNKITNIEEDTFKGLVNLKTLYLTHNGITNITEGTFKNLVNLEKLNLERNNITNIEEDAFEVLVNLKFLNLERNKITNIEEDAFKGLVNLKYLSLWGNGITNITEGAFKNLVNLEKLFLAENKLTNIEEDAFKSLINLKIFYLSSNRITNITEGTFKNLVNLEKLYLINNQIITHEDGAFLFLPSITKIDLNGNDNMTCGCHLPAIVDYLERAYNRSVTVHGKCRNNQMKSINILEYSECKNYSLFQRKLQCKTCSGITCKDSEVTSCPGAEPVCMNRISMSGVTLKSDKSCSTYRECVAAKKNDTFTCNKLTGGTSYVTCCTGHLCNKYDFIVATMKEPMEIEARLEKLEKLVTHLVETMDSIQSQRNDVYIDIHGGTTNLSHPHLKWLSHG